VAYSFPHIKQSGNYYIPSVAIHLAKSEDSGNTWSFVKNLFEPISLNNPANTNQNGFLDHEVINFITYMQLQRTIGVWARWICG